MPPQRSPLGMVGSEELPEPTQRANNPLVPQVIPSALPTVERPLHGDHPSLSSPAWDAPSDPTASEDELSKSLLDSLAERLDRSSSPTSRAAHASALGFLPHPSEVPEGERDHLLDPKLPDTDRLPDDGDSARIEGESGEVTRATLQGERTGLGARAALPAWGYMLAFLAVVAAGGSFIFAGLAPFQSKEEPIVIPPSRTAHVKGPITIAPIAVRPSGARSSGPPTEGHPSSGSGPRSGVPEAPALDRETRVDPKSVGPIELVVPSPSKGPKGMLVVSARPASTVYVNGKKKGFTPVKVRLPVGKHKVTIKGPDGEKRTITKVVSAGKTTTIIYRWPK
jgi:hypothetical protein